MAEKSVSVTEASRNLARIIRQAAQNRATLITRKGKVVARIVPVRSAARAAKGAAFVKARTTTTPKTASGFEFVGCLKGPDGTNVLKVDDYLYGEDV